MYQLGGTFRNEHQNGSTGYARLAHAWFDRPVRLNFLFCRTVMAKNVSHVANKTARDRLRQRQGRLYVSDNLLFCKACEVTLDHRRKSTN